MLKAKTHPAFFGHTSVSTAMIKTEVEASKAHGGWPAYIMLDADTRAALVVEMMLDRAVEALRAYDQKQAAKKRPKSPKGKR